MGIVPLEDMLVRLHKTLVHKHTGRDPKYLYELEGRNKRKKREDHW